MNTYRFTDIYCGLSESFQVTVTAKAMEAFGEISGDLNPLHIDSNFAAQYGFPDKVVYGMLTASFYSKLVGMYMPGKHALFQGANISFTAPVFIGDVLTVAGEVVFLNEAYKQIEVKASIINQNGQKVSRAKLQVGFNE